MAKAAIKALLSANLLSLIGNQLSAIAIPWFVLQLTGSPIMTAGVLVAGQLPNIVAGLLSGVVIDRHGARRISLVCDAINALAIVMIPLLYTLDALSIGLLAVLVFTSQMIDVPGETAKQVLVSQLIDRDDLPRERTNGWYALTATTADLLGPTLAGMLLTAIGATLLLWLDALTFFIAFLLLAFGVPYWSTMPNRIHRSPIGQQLWADWILLWRTLPLRKLAVFDLLLNTVAVSLLSLTLPVLVRHVEQPAYWLGWWLSAFAIGTTATTVIYMWIGHRVSNLLLLRLTPLGQAVGLLVVLGSIDAHSMVGVALGLLFYGLHLGVGSMVDSMLLQQLVPEHSRGTIFAAFGAWRYVGVPAGLLLSGVWLSAAAFTGLFVCFVLLLVLASLLWWSADLGKSLKNG